MASKNTLTLKNAPKADGKAGEDTADITESLKALEAADRLAEHVEANPPSHAEVATDKLKEFRLSKVALALLDKALVNVAENTGRGLEDEQAKKQAQLLGGIVAVAEHDLSKAITFIIAAVPVEQAVGTIYSLCYSVQKAMNFIGNMAYRKALDPASDFDLEQFVDYREDEHAAPYGLQPEGEFTSNDRKYEGQPDHEVVFDALEEVHIYLQLITEAFGWDATQPMPYMAVMNKDETFTQVHDLEQCLDAMEIRFKESRRKRQEQRTANLAATLAHAQKALLKASAKS